MSTGNGQFKPGQSGNPGGKRKGTRSLTAILRDLLEEKDDEFGTKADKLIHKVVETATDGDYRMFKEIIDRVDGPVVQKQETDHKVTIKRVILGDEPMPEIPEALRPRALIDNIKELGHDDLANGVNGHP